MKKVRVGINGFGRIGRAIYRINSKKQFFDIVAINDINPDINNMAYLLKYDTTYGRFSENIEQSNEQLIIGSSKIQVYHEEKILDVPWENHNIDIVIDSSGIKANIDPMLNDKSSVKNFVVTNAPSGFDQIKTIIFGVNENQCNPNKHKVFSASICDTIALAPIINIIKKTHDIETGFLVTLHPWLSYQNLLDGPSASWSQPGDIFSHYSLGRASTENLIPKSTSAMAAADHVFPGISKKIQSFSYRIPTKIVSSAVLILLLAESTSKSEIQAIFQEYENTQEYNVIHNSIEPLTSLDYCGEEYSAILDQRWTKVENNNHIKLVYWYDNEWGYSSRVVDLVKKISESY